MQAPLHNTVFATVLQTTYIATTRGFCVSGRDQQDRDRAHTNYGIIVNLERTTVITGSFHLCLITILPSAPFCAKDWLHWLQTYG
jgi:hypothetical protein